LTNQSAISHWEENLSTKTLEYIFRDISAGEWNHAEIITHILLPIFRTVTYNFMYALLNGNYLLLVVGIVCYNNSPYLWMIYFIFF
jgi:hypothetical protein